MKKTKIAFSTTFWNRHFAFKVRIPTKERFGHSTERVKKWQQHNHYPIQVHDLFSDTYLQDMLVPGFRAAQNSKFVFDLKLFWMTCSRPTDRRRRLLLQKWVMTFRQSVLLSLLSLITICSICTCLEPCLIIWSSFPHSIFCRTRIVGNIFYL